MAESRNSLVLTDWAGSVTAVPTMADPNTLLWTLMLHALLRDNVLIQDEALVLNEALAEWFAAGLGRQMLEELFETEAFTVLKFPRQAYPRADLRLVSEDNPIEARAKYLSEYSTRAGQRFSPTETQMRFYAGLDSILVGGANRHRERASDRESYYTPLSRKLRDVLKDRFEQYKPWLDSAIGPMSDAVRGELLGYIENPESAERAINRARNSVKGGKRDRGHLITRSLFYRLADAVFPEEQRMAVKRLVQSAFAAGFCESERACGSYGPGLNELMVLPEDYQCAPEPIDRFVMKAGPVVRHTLGLPAPQPGFSKVISKVRESDAGKELRRLVPLAGRTFDFAEESRAWREVSGLLAANMTGGSVRLEVFRTFWELPKAAMAACAGLTVVNGLRSLPVHVDVCSFLVEQGLGALAHGGVIVAGAAVYDLCRHYMNRQDLRMNIEHAVEFRCTEVPLQAIGPENVT